MKDRQLFMVWRVALFAALLWMSVSLKAQNNPNDIVLVSAMDTEVEILSSLDLRKLYLGLMVSQNGVELAPVIYEPNEEMKSIFLQSIVGMTSRSYERKVLQVRLDSGGGLIPSLSSQTEIIEKLESVDAAVSFMTYSEAEINGLKVIQTLWQSTD